MNILHLINSTRPEGGGPIEAILQAGRELAQAGHQTAIACVDDPSSPWIREIPLPVEALGPAVSPYRYAPRLLPWLRNALRGWDAVLVHGIWLYPSFAAWRACRAAQVPYFVYAHGLLDPVLRRVFPFRHLKKAVWWRMVEHRIVRDAAGILFTCEEERRLASQAFRPYCPARTEIAPYCVREPPGNPDAQKKAFLERFPECAQRRNWLFLSRLHPKKGCDILLEAFARVTSDANGVRLVIAGPDVVGWRRELQTLAQRLGVSGRVTWTGMLSGDLKWGAFRSSELFVLPSHQENFGIAVVEALACGVPVVITEKVNLRREIQADQAGLVEADNADGMARALARWLSLAREARREFAERARACFARRFRSEEAARALLRALGARDQSGNHSLQAVRGQSWGAGEERRA